MNVQKRRKMMMYSTINLLPCSKLDKISVEEKKRILTSLIFYCKNIEWASQSLYAKRYDQFDAQVSENLCQIRAYQLILSFKNDSPETIAINLIKKRKSYNQNVTY